jgi:prevent-host-death family protein
LTYTRPPGQEETVSASARAAIGVVNVRDLQRETSRILEELEAGTSFLVTRRGRPIATVTPIDDDALEDFVLANAPEFVANRREADEAIARGEKGKPLAEVMEELDSE